MAVHSAHRTVYLAQNEGLTGLILSRSVKDLTIKLVTKDGEGFIDWVDENAESIMDDLRTRFEHVSE